MDHSSKVRDSFKYLFPDELPFLKKLVRELPFNSVVVINIGAGAGTSGVAIFESRGDLELHTIDITDLSSPFGCLEAERDEMKKAGFWPEFRMSWFQYHMSSTRFAENSNPRFEAHMVFVDGDHSYKGCKADIENFLPMIVEGGVIAVHDYDKGSIPPNSNGPHPKTWEGVNQAVDELLVDKYELIGRVDSLIAFRV